MHSEHLRNLNYYVNESQNTTNNPGARPGYGRQHSHFTGSYRMDASNGQRRPNHPNPSWFNEHPMHNSVNNGSYMDQAPRRLSNPERGDGMRSSVLFNSSPGSRRVSNPVEGLRSSVVSNSSHGNRFESRSSWHGSSQHPRGQYQAQQPKIQYNKSSCCGSQGLRSSNLQYDADDTDFDDRTMSTSTLFGTQTINPHKLNRAKDMTCPEGDVTITYTDIQGSTSLWESCPTDMKKAQDIHDSIMRQCYTNHSGYEITTEGDAFNLAFHHPVDALAFALEAQIKLYKADWPPGILQHADGKDEPQLKFRGFRVRFGIHHGPTSSKVHEMTRRTVYSGEGVKIAKAIEGMCHGGQILCSMETWMAVSGMAERYLGRPQILDCGEHLLFETTVGGTTTRYTRRIIQLVPQELSFDFFEARGRKEVKDDNGTTRLEIKNSSHVSGRLFPPVVTKRQLTTGFLNAPYANGRVTICFVYTKGLEDNPSTRDRKIDLVAAKFVRKELLKVNPPGYECHEDNGCWMLAFDRMANAVSFGLNLVNDMAARDDHTDIFFKVGMVSGPFTSMGPHKTTGMVS